MSRKFLLEEKDIFQGTISLYLAMEAIYDTKNTQSISWAYDRAITFNYTIEDLQKYHEPCNQLWYYLEGRFAKFGKGNFNDFGLSPIFEENFKELLPIADLKHKGKDFHRLILANLGTEFYEYIIPKMAVLINKNTGIPKSLLKTFYSLIAIMTFGVIFPLILQSIFICNSIDTFLTLSFVNLTTISLLYFLVEFYDLLREEINTNKKSSH